MRDGYYQIRIGKVDSQPPIRPPHAPKNLTQFARTVFDMSTDTETETETETETDTETENAYG